MHVSLRGPVCGYVYTSAHAHMNCVFVLPGTVHTIPKDPYMCVCNYVCVCLHHSSCLLVSIYSLKTELHSESLRAATFRAPPKQTHISKQCFSGAKLCSEKWNLHNRCVRRIHLTSDKLSTGWAASFSEIKQVLHL